MSDRRLGAVFPHYQLLGMSDRRHDSHMTWKIRDMTHICKIGDMTHSWTCRIWDMTHLLFEVDGVLLLKVLCVSEAVKGLSLQLTHAAHIRIPAIRQRWRQLLPGGDLRHRSAQRFPVYCSLVQRIYVKRGLLYGKIVAIFVERDLLHVERGLLHVKRDLVHVERDLLYVKTRPAICQKRPTKETCGRLG
jgi:hypothetical protein